MQERDDSLGERRQQLRVLNKSGRSMYFTSETSPEHRERISRDLTVINERWNSVSGLFTYLLPPLVDPASEVSFHLAHVCLFVSIIVGKWLQLSLETYTE